MIRANLVVVVMIGMCSALAVGQAPPADGSDPAAEPVRHQLFLADGSVLAGRLEEAGIVVETDYGTLTVPVEDVVGLVPGVNRRTDLDNQIKRAVAELGSSTFDLREKAEQKLLAMGPPVIALLRQAAVGDNLERKERLESVIAQLEQMQMDLADDPWSENELATPLIRADRVTARQFTIVGRIKATSLTLNADYGQLTVDLASIKKAQVMSAEPEPVVAALQITGEDMAMMTHRQTRIRVNRGDRISIRATGRITMTPWGGQAFTTPDGMPAYGYYLPNEIPMGALVGRIGGDGQVFLIGSSRHWVAEKSGQLELAFAMQAGYANNQFPGEFKVRIRVDPK